MKIFDSVRFPLPLRERARVRGFWFMRRRKVAELLLVILRTPLTPTLSLKGRGRRCAL
jgi:hypothetical protein